MTRLRLLSSASRSPSIILGIVTKLTAVAAATMLTAGIIINFALSFNLKCIEVGTDYAVISVQPLKIEVASGDSHECNEYYEYYEHEEESLTYAVTKKSDGTTVDSGHFCEHQNEIWVYGLSPSTVYNISIKKGNTVVGTLNFNTLSGRDIPVSEDTSPPVNLPSEAFLYQQANFGAMPQLVFSLNWSRNYADTGKMMIRYSFGEINSKQRFLETTEKINGEIEYNEFMTVLPTSSLERGRYVVTAWPVYVTAAGTEIVYDDLTCTLEYIHSDSRPVNEPSLSAVSASSDGSGTVYINFTGGWTPDINDFGTVKLIWTLQGASQTKQGEISPFAAGCEAAVPDVIPGTYIVTAELVFVTDDGYTYSLGINTYSEVTVAGERPAKMPSELTLTVSVSDDGSDPVMTFGMNWTASPTDAGTIYGVWSVCDASGAVYNTSSCDYADLFREISIPGLPKGQYTAEYKLYYTTADGQFSVGSVSVTFQTRPNMPVNMPQGFDIVMDGMTQSSANFHFTLTHTADPNDYGRIVISWAAQGPAGNAASGTVEYADAAAVVSLTGLSEGLYTISAEVVFINSQEVSYNLGIASQEYFSISSAPVAEKTEPVNRPTNVNLTVTHTVSTAPTLNPAMSWVSSPSDGGRVVGVWQLYEGSTISGTVFRSGTVEYSALSSGVVLSDLGRGYYTAAFTPYFISNEGNSYIISGLTKTVTFLANCFAPLNSVTAFGITGNSSIGFTPSLWWTPAANDYGTMSVEWSLYKASNNTVAASGTVDYADIGSQVKYGNVAEGSYYTTAVLYFVNTAGVKTQIATHTISPFTLQRSTPLLPPTVTLEIYSGDGISASVNIDWTSSPYDTGTVAGIGRLYIGQSATPQNLVYTSEILTEMPTEIWFSYFWNESEPPEEGWYLVTFTPVYILADGSINELTEYAVSEEIYYADGPVNMPTQYELYFNEPTNSFYATAAWQSDAYGTIGVEWYAYNLNTNEYFQGWHDYSSFGTAIDLSELSDGYYNISFYLKYRTVTGMESYLNMENSYSEYSYTKGQMQSVS